MNAEEVIAETLISHLYALDLNTCECLRKKRNPIHLGFKAHARHQASMVAQSLAALLGLKKARQ